MPLQPGFNIVTEEMEKTDEELPALAFFRCLANDEDVPSRVTVTHLEDLLFYAPGEERTEIISNLRRLLRNTKSLTSMTAVQFLIDGRFMVDDRFRIRIEHSGSATHLTIGELFVEEPELRAPTHAVARK